MSNPLEDNNKMNIKKIELLKNNEDYKNISPKLNYLIDYELIDIFKNILNEPKIEFLSFIMIKVKSYLLTEYKQQSFDEELFKYLMKRSKEKLEKKYNIHLQNLSSAYDDFQLLKKNKKQNNEIENNYLKNFEYHCSETSEYAIHNCEKDEKIFGKFIKVIDKSNKKNLVKYVLCERCRKAYFIEHFENYCEKCDLNYFSCEVNDDQKDMVMASLKTPHCEPVVNEKLHCQFCKSILYLNMKNNQIKCTNCRFIGNQNNMDCICNICSKPFKSDIIVYNKSEVNYIKKVINYGLLIKKLARPIKLPCCKNVDVKTVSFYHKKDCKGTIYFAEFHKKLIIICEKCKAVNNFGKFIWTCPICSMRFKDMKWQDNEIRLRKEIFNVKDVKISIDLGIDDIVENRINRNNIDKDNLNLVNTIDIKTRSKNKSNLHEILKKRTIFVADKNKTEIHNIVPKKLNKENKEVSTEGSDNKNNHNLNIDIISDNPSPDFIKVRKNIESLSDIKKKEIKTFVIDRNKESKKKDKMPSDRKNMKKRYIFEKLIRRQFVSANNIMANNFVTDGNQNEKENQEKIEINCENQKTKEKDENEGKIWRTFKKKFIEKMRNSQSNSDMKRIPKENRVKQIEKIDLEEINNKNSDNKENDIKKNNDNLFDEKKVSDKNEKSNIVSYSEVEEKQITANIMKKKEIKNEIFIKNNKDFERFKKNDKEDNKNNLELNSFPSERKLNVKRYLFKFPGGDDKNKSNNKGLVPEILINNNSQNENKLLSNNISYKNFERDIKIKRRFFNKEFKFNKTIVEKNDSDNNNKNQKGIIDHCSLSNEGLRKAYKDSYYKTSEKNLAVQVDPKNDLRENENKVAKNFNYKKYISNNKNKNNNNNNKKIIINININNNISINNIKNNNSNNNNNNKINNTYYYNSNKKNDYSSISMKNIKNNSNPTKKEEKTQFDNNIFKKRKEKNLNELKKDSEKEEEKEEEKDDEPPDDVVRVFNIDEMEKIPINSSVIKNPLLCNNIQQRIKHMLFRGKLPLFNVDNYTITETLGQGTNGVIYQVINNKTKKHYAMKKLIASTVAELDFYQKEFKILYENPHPYILNIYGVCARCFDSTTYVLYVLMALAEKDLEMEIVERIKTRKYFQEKELIAMLKKLVEALYYLQKERNVAHRDIKPENILIFKNDVLKLADFGEAKINNNSKKKTIRGTEFYMSPLLYAGNLESKYDIQHNPFKSDVFSLGYCFIYASCLNNDIINEIRKISDQNKLRQILKKYFPKMYSPRYIELLLKMIENDENQRVDFIGLQNILQYY